MSQEFRTATKFAGLATYPNSLSDVQPGSLQIADNVVVDKPGTVSSRPGQRVYATNNGGFGDTIPTRLFQVGEQLYGGFSNNGRPDADLTIQRIVAGSAQPAVVSGIDSITPPPGNAAHSVETRNVALVSTRNFIAKVVPDPANVTSGTLQPAGIPYGLDLQPSLTAPAAGTQGFLAGGYATAYRAVFGATDGQGNTVLGAPSPSVQLENPTFEQSAINAYDPTYGTANYFTVNLPFTPSNPGNVGPYDCYVVQGGTVLAAQLTVLAGASVARIILRDPAVFLGPSGTTLSVVLTANVVSVAAGPPAVLTFSNLDPRILKPTAGSFTPVVYSPVNTAQPGNTSGASVLSTLDTSTATATACTTVSGTWADGTVGIVVPVTMGTIAQSDTILLTTTTLKVGDVLTLPGVTVPVTVTAVPAASVYTLDSFPTGLLIDATYFTVTVGRPKNVTLTATVPIGIQNLTSTTGYSCFMQLYRSGTQAPILSSGITAATDNMQLAYEATIGTSVTQVTIVDIAPDATLGTDLYTAPRQGGAISAKYPPPVASDVCIYESTLLLGDCYLPAALDSQLLGVSTSISASLRALQPGDVIQIVANGVTFTFTAISGGVPTANQFLIVTGTGSITNDIYRTVLNLSQAVNRKFIAPTVPPATPTTEAVTLLSTSALGSMGGNFRVQTSNGLGTFNIMYVPANGQPSPFTTALNGSEIEPTRQQNVLYYSQPSEPEAVPLLNFIPVGQSNTQIQRILPVPGACIIFKPEGIYQLTGTDSSNFRITILNTTAQLLANETAVVLQSSVIAFTNQGVVTVSQGGVQITSIAINQTLLDLVQLPAFAATSFAVAHEAERRYIVWVPTTSTDTLPTQAYAYNVLTNAWTRWPIARLCGLANRADQLLYTGASAQVAIPGTPALYQETPPGSTYRYGDEAVSGTIDPLTATTIKFTPSGSVDLPSITANFPVGSALVVPVASTSIFAGVVLITSITNSGSYLTLGVASTWNFTTTTGCTLYQGVSCQFAPVPIYPDDPGTVKQFQEFEVEFENTDCPTVTAECATDFGYDTTDLSLAAVGVTVGAGYGSGTWGAFPWGTSNPNAPVFAQNARQLVPRGATRGHYWWPVISSVVACNGFHAQGLTLAWQPTASLRSR